MTSVINSFCKLTLTGILSSETVVMTDPDLGPPVITLMRSIIGDLAEKHDAWTRESPFPSRLTESDIRGRVMSAIKPTMSKTINWFIETDGLKFILDRLISEATKGEVRRIVKEVTLDGQDTGDEDPLTLEGMDDLTKALISHDFRMCMGRSLVEEHDRLRMDRERSPSSPWCIFNFDVVLADDDGRFYAFSFALQLSSVIRELLAPRPTPPQPNWFCFLVSLTLVVLLMVLFTWLCSHLLSLEMDEYHFEAIMPLQF